MSSNLYGLDLVNQAPKGTKLYLLHCGNLEADDGWMIRGAGTSTASNPMAGHPRRKAALICILVDHPSEGLILFETGPGKDQAERWGVEMNEVFSRVDYHPDQELPAQIRKCGHDITDVKAVIMGHLHGDHAGGLSYFKDTGVPIYVHEKEIKNAAYSVATKSDIGPYLPSDLDLTLNWKAIHGPFLEFAQGMNIRHSPGHTPGLCVLQVNMPDSGAWIFTTDQYHVKENWESDVPQGWLARDHDDWVASHQMIKMLQKRTNAKMVLGHDFDVFFSFKHAPHAYT